MLGLTTGKPLNQMEKDKSASACIACKKCETICPKHLKISKLMKESILDFEK